MRRLGRGDNLDVMTQPLKNIVVLISGTGSNMQAIADAAQKEHWLDRFGARMACVISNKPDAEGLGAAKALGIATHALDHHLPKISG